ncbi:hypothetical protein ACSSS7_002960 [Eimeria intestinalis]
MTPETQTPLATISATPSATTEAADLPAEEVVSASDGPVKAATTNDVVQNEALKETSTAGHRGPVFLQDLISMAEYLLDLQQNHLQLYLSPRLLQGSALLSVETTRCAGKRIVKSPEDDASTEVLARDFVLEVSHLKQMLSEHFSTLGMNPAGSLGCFDASSTSGGKAILRTGECNAQLDSHGDIVSLTLSSIAHLVALSHGVLLTFSKLRVLLLPLNGLRSFAPRTSAPACESLARTKENSSGPPALVQLPQLKVLDLSFNELCTLEGFWGTAAPQLRQLWIAGNPLQVRPDISQQLQQLLPALELLDGHSLLETTATLPDHLATGAELPLLAHESCPTVGEPVRPHPPTAATKGPLNWDLASAAQLRFQGAQEGQKYWAEDAQHLACSFIIPKLGARAMPGESRLSGGAEPLPLALLLPACAGPSRMCCCFCCCCCSCSKQDALSLDSCRTSINHWSASNSRAVAAPQQMDGCGGLCSVAAAIRTAALSHWDRLYDQQEARTPFCPTFAWANWRERVDVLEMSFLRLRDAPNIQSFVGLRRLELSENRLKTIEVCYWSMHQKGLRYGLQALSGSCDATFAILSLAPHLSQFHMCCGEKEYRSYSLYLLPFLKILDGVEPDQKETDEIKHVFAGRLTRELVEQIVGRPLPCLEGCAHELMELKFANNASKKNSPASAHRAAVYQIDSWELVLAHNNIDITAGGLGGSEGPGLSAVPLLEGASESLRCLILERNGLRSLYGLSCLPNLEDLRVAQNRIPDLTQAEYLLQLPKLKRLGFQQNPACQRRHWRAVLAEQLPHLEAIDGEAILVEDLSRVHLGCTTDGAPCESDNALSLHKPTSEDTVTAGPSLNLTPQQHNLLPQYQRLTPHSTKPPKCRLLLPSKQGEVSCSGPSLLRQPMTSSDLKAFSLGVMGVGAPGANIGGGTENAQPRHESFLIGSGKRRAT